MHIWQNRLSRRRYPTLFSFIVSTPVNIYFSDAASCAAAAHVSSKNMYVKCTCTYVSTLISSVHTRFSRLCLHLAQLTGSLLCITHKSIEKFYGIFLHVAFLFVIVLVRFFFFHYRSSALCCSSRRGNGYRDQGCVVWLTKISRSFCMYGCTCVSVCLRQCVVACVCVCVYVNRVVVGDAAPAVLERDEGQRVSCLASKRNEINSK